MKDRTDRIVWEVPASSQAINLAADLDWQAVASQRLKRLVEIEHQYALLAIRHEASQDEIRTSVRHDVNRLERIRTLEDDRDRLRVEIASLEGRLAAMLLAQNALLGSRSWQVTKPLRAMARWIKHPRRAAKSGLLRLARRAPIRGVFKAVLTLAPGLRARVEAFMYPRGH